MLKLEKRDHPSSRMRFLAPLLSVILTLIVGLMLFALLGKNPLQAFEVLVIHPINSMYGVSELLLKATPLILIGLGLAIGFRANVWNIGAEGQFIIGAVAASGVALFFPIESRFWMLTMMMVGGMLGGMCWSALVAWLRTAFNANEILVSLMLVYVAQLFASYLVYGPWIDPEGYGFPQTKLFAEQAILPIILEETRLTIAFIGAMLALLVAYIFMFRSFAGFKMLVSGFAPMAARYAGFSTQGAIWTGMLVGGAMAGLAGMAEVAGPAGQLTEHVASGYGFAAIIVAYIGRLHPVGIFLAGLLMALLFLGGEQAQQTLGLPSSIGRVFQGSLLFFLLACDILITYRVTWRSNR